MELRALEREANAQRELLESYLARLPRGVVAQGRQLPAGGCADLLPRDRAGPSPISRNRCRSQVRPSSARCSSWRSSRCCRSCFLAAQCARRLAGGSKPEMQDEPPPGRAALLPKRRCIEEPAAKLVAEPASVAPVAAQPRAEVAVAAEIARASLRESRSRRLPRRSSCQAGSRRERCPPRRTSFRRPVKIEPAKIEPIRHEPLPEMKVERESFSEAWERHRRMMDAAKYVAQPAEDNPAEFDEPDIEEVPHEEEVEEPIMRNPFARRKPAPPRTCSEPALPDRHRRGQRR